MTWPLPSALGERLHEAAQVAWFARLAEQSAALARRWGLTLDGPPWSGFWSAVWPVRDRAQQALVLKMSVPTWPIAAEAAALCGWHGHGVVGLVDDDLAENALLLERLDGDRSLETLPDVDEACATIAQLLAGLHAERPRGAFESLPVQAHATAESIRRRAREHSDLLPAVAIDHAVEVWNALADAPEGCVLHHDAHFLNVLGVLGAPGAPEDPAGWKLIDPWPARGPIGFEIIPALRNRWADAAATGDPDRALRRRVAVMCEILGCAPERVRAYAQAAAVDDLLDILRAHPDSMFIPPYRVLAGWTDSR